MIKIAKNKAALRGKNGVGVTLPAFWVKENNVKPGQDLNIYRGEVPGVGKDCLVIKNPDTDLTKEK